MSADVSQKVARVRWIFLPLGLCALAAVGAHAAAADRAGAFFDSIFARWSLTAPLVELIGPAQRTWLARAVALSWELAGDALLAVPLLNYQERAAAEELRLSRALLRPPARLLRPAAMALIALAGARAVARLLQGSLLHFAVIGRLAAAAALVALLAVLLPRAVFRSLESAPSQTRRAALELIVLAPLALAAALSL